MLFRAVIGRTLLPLLFLVLSWISTYLRYSLIGLSSGPGITCFVQYICFFVFSLFVLCYETDIPLLFWPVCKIVQRTRTVVGTVRRSIVVFNLQKKNYKVILKLTSVFKRPYIFVPGRQRRQPKKCAQIWTATFAPCVRYVFYQIVLRSYVARGCSPVLPTLYILYT